ncbi:class I SAM-dependent methyltransferase [bacterium SCSIO 12827]|nr:class I SAM-dependent methyltransferase [bacterium SCSIO 12827]
MNSDPISQGHRACMVCDAPLVPAHRYPGLLKCDTCGFHTADVSLSPEKIRALYGHDYFHGAEYGDYIEEKNALQINFIHRLAEIRALPGLSASSKLFEIGCAYGFFMEMADTVFSDVAGIDIAADAVAYARDDLGLNAVEGDFLEADLPFTPDIICMWDVIEHLERPDLVLKKSSEILAPGGYLCITTGDIGSFTARLRGPNWRMIHPPTHLHYFSVATLGRLLQRSGMDLMSVTHPAVKRTIGSMLYGVFDLRLGAHKLYSLLSRLPGQDLTVSLNLHDIMLVIARKPT